MPALSATSLLNEHTYRDAISNASTANTTSNALHVVCAWPVSGQYGPGSRYLYYVLVAACLVARKSEQLRAACLAAALLFPAVAAFHAIVLAAVHVDGAVDMDVYGAFELCAIGILAAPATVRLSRTYFYTEGRNLIFLWTGLILAGLLSLTIEFYRSKPSECTTDNGGNPVSSDASNFPYGDASCNLNCSVAQGPHSPLRGGSANNIYVIPAPHVLNFDTATLLAAACCIPAILSLISMWMKILELNWRTRFGYGSDDHQIDEPIEGTNGATIGKMRKVNDRIRFFLSALGIPVFGGAILTILIIGEINFFSGPVRYQTEPIASIGQWAPIVGTGLAALGSVYLLFAADVAEEESPKLSTGHCNCSHHHHHHQDSDQSSLRSDGLISPLQGITGPIMLSSPVASPGTLNEKPQFIDGSPGTPIHLAHTASRPTQDSSHQVQPSDLGSRRKVAKGIIKVANFFGTAAYDQFDDSEFKQGKASDFPEIPGEENRNRALNQIREKYNRRDTGRSVSPRPRSRAESFTDSVRPEIRSASPVPSLAMPQKRQNRSSTEPQHASPSASTDVRGRKTQKRRDTLDVPSPVHFGYSRHGSNPSVINRDPEPPNSPTIVVSPDPEVLSSTNRPALDR